MEHRKTIKTILNDLYRNVYFNYVELVQEARTIHFVGVLLCISDEDILEGIYVVVFEAYLLVFLDILYL